ncbi:hypothetical protein [Candidatus Ichthyocystis hellenicum]|uniref:hypothetical protein n=1 Tax=Candidatus Ichthyocystis hellenicum TaxID=1561003 RepID=UPI000B809686|nr:hypothetical protein [Candidatus Ichthyocystis hellenicum]
MLSRDQFFHFPFSQQALEKLLAHFYTMEESLPKDNIFSHVIAPSPDVSALDDDLVSFLVSLDSGSFEEVVVVARRIVDNRLAPFAVPDYRDAIHARVCQLFMLIGTGTYCRIAAAFSKHDLFTSVQDLFLSDPWLGFIVIHLLRSVVNKFPHTSSYRVDYKFIDNLRKSFDNFDCVFPPFVKTGEKNTEWEHVLDAYRDTELFSSSFKHRFLFLKRLDQESYFSYCLRLTNVLPSFSRLILLAQAIISVMSVMDDVTDDQESCLRKNLVSHYGNSEIESLVLVFHYLIENRIKELPWAREEDRNILLATVLKLIHTSAEQYIALTSDAVCKKLSELSDVLPEKFSGGLVLSRNQWIPHTDREVDLAAASALLSDSSSDVQCFLQNYQTSGSANYRLLVSRLGQKLRYSPGWVPVESVRFLIEAIADDRVSYPLMIRVGSLWLMVLREVDHESIKALKAKVGNKKSRKLRHHNDKYILYDFRHGASYDCGKMRRFIEVLWALLGVQIWRSSSDSETINNSLVSGRSAQCNVGPFVITRCWSDKLLKMEWSVDRVNWPSKKFFDPITLRRWLRVEYGIYRDGAVLQESLYSSVDSDENFGSILMSSACSCKDKAVRNFLLQGHQADSVEEMEAWNAMYDLPIVSPASTIDTDESYAPDIISMSQVLLGRSSAIPCSDDSRFFAWGGLVTLCCRQRGSYWWQNGLTLLRNAFYCRVDIDFVINSVSLLPRVVGFGDSSSWIHSENYLALAAGLSQLYNLPLSVADLGKWRSFLARLVHDSPFEVSYDCGVCPAKVLEPHTLSQ